MPMPWRKGASAPVTIARTPGIRRAAEVSMRTMRADGTSRARQRRVQHAGAGAIDRIARAAAQLVARIAPREIHRDCWWRRTSFSPRFGGLDKRKRRVKNALVARAAADISDQRSLHIVPVGIFGAVRNSS